MIKIPPNTDPHHELRQEIVEVASKRFSRHGFKSVTMDDLARDLGMSKKTLYEVVGNKQTLIDLVLDTDMECDDQAILGASEKATDAIEEMLEIARHFTQTMRDTNPASLYDLQKYYRKSWERLDGHHNEKMIEHVRANLRRGQSEGLYRDELHFELIAQIFVSAPQAMMDPDRMRVGQEEWNNLANQLIHYHLLGVCSPAGRALLTTYLERSPNA
ncbi:MAG: TetR/AcrR family transcriptional regulator [Saprospiraceae bacterium]